jgi:hypothetical protein
MTVSDNQRAQSSDNHAPASGASRTHPSDRSQAKRFAKILRSDLAEMREKVIAAEVDWHLHCEAEGYTDPPQRLTVARERINEVERMLKALGARFPRTYTTKERMDR